MKKYDILFSFGQFLMDCRMNEAAHFVMLNAANTKDSFLKSRALTQVARVALRRKRPDAGFALALDAIKANPKNDDAWFVAAGSAEIIGSMDATKLTAMNAKKFKYFDDVAIKSMNEKGLKYIEQAIALNPNEPNYYDQKVVFLAKVGRLSEAKEVLDLMISKFPTYRDINNMKKKQAGLDLLIADK